MTVLHTGSTKKFVSGWENIFAGKSKAKPAVAKQSAKKKSSASKKQAANKGRGKKSARAK